jgi:hypothetical protein
VSKRIWQPEIGQQRTSLFSNCPASAIHLDDNLPADFAIGAGVEVDDAYSGEVSMGASCRSYSAALLNRDGADVVPRRQLPLPMGREIVVTPSGGTERSKGKTVASSAEAALQFSGTPETRKAPGWLCVARGNTERDLHNHGLAADPPAPRNNA